MTDAEKASAGHGLTIALMAAGLILVLASGAIGYGLGKELADDEVDAVAAEAEAFDSSYARALMSSRVASRERGAKAGRGAGKTQGEETGRAEGGAAGKAAADTELERIEAERAAAEAAAAEAAELALPEPCRGMPDSTARRMCIAAVERGDYP